MLVHENKGALAAVVGRRIDNTSVPNVVVVDHSGMGERCGERHADEEEHGGETEGLEISHCKKLVLALYRLLVYTVGRVIIAKL
jgi:hypothetical protein